MSKIIESSASARRVEEIMTKNAADFADRLEAADIDRVKIEVDLTSDYTKVMRVIIGHETFKVITAVKKWDSVAGPFARYEVSYDEYDLRIIARRIDAAHRLKDFRSTSRLSSSRTVESIFEEILGSRQESAVIMTTTGPRLARRIG